MVDRCLCLDLTFIALRRLAVAQRLDFDALRDRTGCCTGCTMCEPYVRVMLRTGRTSLPVMSPDECAAAMRGSRRRDPDA